MINGSLLVLRRRYSLRVKFENLNKRSHNHRFKTYDQHLHESFPTSPIRELHFWGSYQYRKLDCKHRGSMSIAERCCGSYNETKSFEFTVRRARLDIMNILGTTENQVSEKKTRLLKLAQLMFNPSSPQTPNRIQKTSNIIILPFHKSYKLMLCLQKVEMWQQKLEKQFQLTGNMTVYKKGILERQSLNNL